MKERLVKHKFPPISRQVPTYGGTYHAIVSIERNLSAEHGKFLVLPGDDDVFTNSTQFALGWETTFAQKSLLLL